MAQPGEPIGPTSFSRAADAPISTGMDPRPAPDADAPDALLPERRSRQRVLYSKEQLLGRSPIYLRRRRDKQQFVAHLAAAVFLVGLSLWWVIPRHSFAGPVLFTFAPGHGVHEGDLITLFFLAVALRSMVKAILIGRRRPSPTGIA